MTFETRIEAFAERFLSDRAFQLIVEPALADLHFESGGGRLTQAVNRVAVLRAVAGGLSDDVARGCGSFLALALLPACYYMFFLVLCFDFFKLSISTDFFVVAILILVLSFGPVVACFWPERRPARPVD